MTRLDEALPVDPMSFSFDLDTISSLFPVSNNPDGDFGMPGFRFGLDEDFPSDPLFGLMDGPAMTFDLETPSMPL